MTYPDSSPALAARGRGRPREFDIDEALAKAILVFRERGYHATSIADLTAAMGLAAGSVYKAFKDKRAVFLAAFDRYQTQRHRDRLDLVATESPAGRASRICWPPMSRPRMASRDSGGASSSAVPSNCRPSTRTWRRAWRRRCGATRC